MDTTGERFKANRDLEHVRGRLHLLIDDAPLVVEKVYCNFCGDHMGDGTRSCKDCGAYMCEQTHPDGSGCLGVGSVQENAPFFCIVCDPKRWRKQGDRDGEEDGRMPVSLAL